MGKKKENSFKRKMKGNHTYYRKIRKDFPMSSKLKNNWDIETMYCSQKLDIQKPEIVILVLIWLEYIYSQSTFHYLYMHIQCQKQINNQDLDVNFLQQNDDNSSVSTISSDYQPAKNNHGYKFHCNPYFPQSLVVLKSPQQVDGLSNKKIYVWLSKNHQAYYFDLKQILQFLQINMFPIEQIDQASQIMKKFPEKQFQFWCTNKNDIFILFNLFKKLQIKKPAFVFFNEQGLTDQSQQLVQIDQQYEVQFSIIKHFSELKKKLTFERLQNNFLLPNFKKRKSNIISINYEAMSNQNIDRDIIIDKFIELSLLNAREDQQQQILQFNYKAVEPYNYQLIIKTYTKESFLYRFLNRLLRSSQNTLQLYYVSVFIQDLNFAIKKLNLIQRNDPSKQSFVCYRGAAFSQKQWEYFYTNEGTIVHTLAYLSASLDLKTAEQFAINVILQIHVNKQKEQYICECESDYAFIQQFSAIPEEKEVLFRANSSFKICEIKQSLESGTILIKLEYMKSCSHWKGKTSKKNEQINNQGQVLNLLEDRELCRLYWEQKMFLIEKKIQLIYEDYENLKSLLI